jgi:NAD(P)-dependent dehydrogenase (short-subunit alcohol dehydrogenase family)
MKTVIAAAYGGIGSALVSKLAAAGHELLLLGRNAEKLQTLGHSYAALDLTNLEALESALTGFGPIDAFVNCTGSILLKPAHITSEADFDQTIATNLKTAFFSVRAATKNMPSGGSIVLMATAAARIGYANHEAIAAAKGGVIGLTLSAAATYANRNIRVNCVAPGLVDTPLSAKITANEAALKTSMSLHALNRIGKPEDVANMLAFLVDPANSWITGQVFGIDGGLGALRAR